MVASRKGTARKSTKPKRRESLEAMFQRVIAEPADAPFPKLTKPQARYFLRRIWETGNPDDSPPGDEQVKRFYGLWPEPDDDSYPD